MHTNKRRWPIAITLSTALVATPASARAQVPTDVLQLDRTVTIATDRTQVVADEPIAIATTLRYIGTAKNEKATLSGPGGGLVAFGVGQLHGPTDTEPGWRPSHGFYRLAPG